VQRVGGEAGPGVKSSPKGQKVKDPSETRPRCYAATAAGGGKHLPGPGRDRARSNADQRCLSECAKSTVELGAAREAVEKRYRVNYVPIGFCALRYALTSYAPPDKPFPVMHKLNQEHLHQACGRQFLIRRRRLALALTRVVRAAWG